MKRKMHKNSLSAYDALQLTPSQAKVIRAILAETKAGRRASIASLYKYPELSISGIPARIGELRQMAENFQPFDLDGEQYVLIDAGKIVNQSGLKADAYKVVSYAVVRAEWEQAKRERAAKTGTQLQLI